VKHTRGEAKIAGDSESKSRSVICEIERVSDAFKTWWATSNTDYSIVQAAFRTAGLKLGCISGQTSQCREPSQWKRQRIWTRGE
jgi:hypothetical protein